MNKKLVLIVPMVLILGACGGNGGASSAKPASSAAPSSVVESSIPASVPSGKEHPWVTEPVTIQWDNTFSYTDAIALMISEFAELEPNVTIVSNKISGGYDAILTQEKNNISTDTYGNLVTCYPDHVAEYIDYGKAVNFDKYFYSEDYGLTKAEEADIVESFLEEGRTFFEKGTYVMPQSKSIEPMYYNSRIIGKTIPGVNNDNPITEEYINNLTWEELFDNFCPKFIEWNKTNKLIKLDPTEWTDTKFGGVVGYDSDSNFAITLFEQYGLPYTSINQSTGYGSVDFNYDDNGAMLKKIREYYKKGYITTQGIEDSYTNYAFTAEQMLFCIGSTGGLKYQLNSDKAFKTMVARLPHAEGKDEKMISQGPGICILTHGNEQQDLACWAFIKYMMEPETSLYWASETGYAPVRYSVYESSEYIEMCDPSAQAAYSVEELKARVFSAYADTKDILYTSPAFKGSSECRSQIGSLLDKICMEADDTYSDLFVQNAFDNAINECKKAIA